MPPFLIHNILVQEYSVGIDRDDIRIQFGTLTPVDEETRDRIGLVLKKYLRAEFLDIPVDNEDAEV